MQAADIIEREARNSRRVGGGQGLYLRSKRLPQAELGIEGPPQAAWRERLSILRGPLCAGEALLEARTQASVALFKLGAHSATLRSEFGGPKSLRCCCAKGVGHRAQLMLRART